MGNNCSKQLPLASPYLAESHDIISTMKVNMSITDYLSNFNKINMDILPDIKITYAHNLRIILIKEFYDYFKQFLLIFLTKESGLLKLNVSITDVIDDIDKKEKSIKSRLNKYDKFLELNQISNFFTSLYIKYGNCKVLSFTYGDHTKSIYETNYDNKIYIMCNNNTVQVYNKNIHKPEIIHTFNDLIWSPNVKDYIKNIRSIVDEINDYILNTYTIPISKKNVHIYLKSKWEDHSDKTEIFYARARLWGFDNVTVINSNIEEQSNAITVSKIALASTNTSDLIFSSSQNQIFVSSVYNH